MNGWKTYAAVAVLVVVAAAKVFGVEIPGFENVDAGMLLTNALGLFGIRWKLGQAAL